MRTSMRAIVAAITAILFALTGCESEPPLPPSYAKTATAMDDIAKGLEEFGTASMSSPVLAAPEDAFKFNLSKVDADQFFANAKSNVQARSAEFSQQASIIGIAGRASFDPTMAAAYASQLAQYQEAVAQNQQSQAVLNLKSQLINSAAIQQYQAAIAQAQQETDPTKKAADVSAAIQALNGSIIGATPTTLPSFPAATQPAAAPMNLAKNASDAAAIFNGPTFLGPQGLLANQPVTLDDGTALDIAAANFAKLAIYRALGDPQLLTKFADKRVLLGAMNVAVNPGWRTKKGYAADIGGMVSWGDPVPARLDVVKNFVKDDRYDLSIRKRIAISYGLDLPTGPAEPFPLDQPTPPQFSTELDPHAGPVVAAVSPMSGSIVEQDENSRRQQVQIALDLAGAYQTAGLTAQANFFDHYAESLQKDVSTIGARVVVNTYSYTGGLFGFQVGPNLRASDPASSSYSPAAEILSRQSIPALVLIGFEDDEIRPRIQRDSAGNFRLVERKLTLKTASRWLPANKPHLLARWTDFIFFNDKSKRLTEDTRIRRIKELNDAAMGMVTDQEKLDLLAGLAALLRPLSEQQNHDRPVADRLRELASRLRDVVPRLGNDAPSLPDRETDKLTAAMDHQALLQSLQATCALYKREREDQRKQEADAWTKYAADLAAWQNAAAGERGPKPKEAKSTAQSLEDRAKELQRAIDQIGADVSRLRSEPDWNGAVASAAGTLLGNVQDANRRIQERIKRADERAKNMYGAGAGAPPPILPSGSLGDTIQARVTELEYRFFDANYDAPLPLGYVAPPPAVKHPNVSQVAVDFVPTLDAPAPTKPTSVRLYGKDLSAVDLTSIAALVPAVNPPSTNGADAPVLQDGVITFKAVINQPKLPAVFVLKITGTTDTIYTPPYLVPRVDTWNPKHPAIRRVTGPLGDPSQQKIDETDFANGVSEKTIQSVNERDKQPRGEHKQIDVIIEPGGIHHKE